MIRTLFINMQKANKGAARPKDVPPAKLETVAVLGAGMMGAGIAYVSAAAGLKVILIDQSQEAADKGKSYTAKLNAKAIERGRMGQAQSDAMLGLITATTAYAGLAAADLVIEAVFETREIKADVTKRAAAVLPAHAVFASNTSTLPITGLGDAWTAAGRDSGAFIGIHFFSPVDKMQLVEIIKGKQTNARALAVAMDYVKRIRKTPIVVNDSRGFYTSRVFGTYTREGMEMLAEGVLPALIENAGKQTGMPMPPLALTDEVALDLVYKVTKQTAKDLGAAYKASPIDPLIEKMVVELGRIGKKAGKGFYDWPADKDGVKRLWPGLKTLVKTKPETEQPDVKDLKTRFLYRQALEAARCYEEGVVTDPADADVGAVLGWGFAPWTGGPLSFIDTVGLDAFVRECDRLAQMYGERFAPNKQLREMARAGTTYYSAATAKAA
jgi:3-hydroxyacyl-CoA dehydrogenase/enoyl-CoA hydratase/3-hydroxybutyryl-CoA epimerase